MTIIRNIGKGLGYGVAIPVVGGMAVGLYFYEARVGKWDHDIRKDIPVKVLLDAKQMAEIPNAAPLIWPQNENSHVVFMFDRDRRARVIWRDLSKDPSRPNGRVVHEFRNKYDWDKEIKLAQKRDKELADRIKELEARIKEEKENSPEARLERLKEMLRKFQKTNPIFIKPETGDGKQSSLRDRSKQRGFCDKHRMVQNRGVVGRTGRAG